MGMSNNSYLNRVTVAKKKDFRNCLKCDKKFKSEGDGNRIYVKCNSENQRESGVREWRLPTFIKGYS